MKYTAIAGTIFIGVILFIVGTLVYGQNSSTINTTSTLVLSPTPTAIPSKAPEPIVTTWSPYSNDKYHFSITYPSGWNQQEYTSDNGNFQVAFSPTQLPCSTCTYVHDGYFSIKIFNPKTDPQEYTLFTQKQQQVGKNNNFRSVQLDGKTGILNANTIDIENNGWVYELSLDRNEGKDLVTDSQLFQKAALSFQFTYLKFNY